MSAKKRDAAWVLPGGKKRGAVGHCTRCGSELRMYFPCELSVVIAAMKAFVAVHRRCKEDDAHDA